MDPILFYVPLVLTTLFYMQLCLRLYWQCRRRDRELERERNRVAILLTLVLSMAERIDQQSYLLSLKSMKGK